MNGKINVMIIDDEALARQSLKDSLADIGGNIDIIAEAENGFEAVKIIQKEKPDLIFLDIQMPKLDGFDLLELLGKDAPPVIFVTAYDEYALKAFEANAVDYLLKPVNGDRLRKALDKALSQMGEMSPDAGKIGKIISDRAKDFSPCRRILIRDGAEVSIIPAEEILYIEAQSDYVEIYTKKGSQMKYENLSRLEEILDPAHFCRIHRSYIININFLQKIGPQTKDTKVAILTNGRNLPISRSGYQKLLEYL